jgi:hypothetical protein
MSAAIAKSVNPMASKPQKDRIYRLKSDSLWFLIPSRNLPKQPLLFFDEEKNVNRALRYAVNQRSPFEDEQDGNAIIENIIFEDSVLSVPRTNPVLQWFLEIHPMNGRLFEEVDLERNAAEQMKEFDTEVDAIIACKGLSIEQCEMITRVMMGKDPSLISTKEMQRDLMVFAKNDPQGFLDCLNDPDLKMQSIISTLFAQNLLGLRNNEKEIWFNTPSNKKKMMIVPFDSTPTNAVCSYFMTDEGMEALRMLETFIQ